MDGENHGKPWTNGWFGGEKHPYFWKHPFLVLNMLGFSVGCWSLLEGSSSGLSFLSTPGWVFFFHRPGARGWGRACTFPRLCWGSPFLLMHHGWLLEIWQNANGWNGGITPPKKNSTSYIHPWKFNSEFTPEKMGGYIVVGRLLFSIGRQLFRGEMLNFRIKYNS